MSEATVNNSALRMPTKPELVAEAIKRFDTLGRRSQLLELDTRTLEDLGLILVERTATISDAHRWLCKELGTDAAEDATGYKAVNRFAATFRSIYEQVRAEHARRLARLSVEQATDGNIQAMSRVGLSRLADLVAEKLVAANNLEELSSTELTAAINTIDAISRGEIKQQELALKVQDAERKARELESKLAEREIKLQRIRQQAEAAKRQVAAQAKDDAHGRTMTREDVYRLIDQVMQGAES